MYIGLCVNIAASSISLPACSKMFREDIGEILKYVATYR